MKTTILCFLFSLCALALTQASSPLLAVQDFIQQAKDGKAELEGVETRGVAKADIIAMLKKVDLEKAIFVCMTENGEQIHWIKDPKDPNLYNVRMANPMCIGFTVRHIPGEKKEDQGRYVVTGVLP